MAARIGSAEWRGDLKGGSGTLQLGESGWTGAYTFKSRFEDDPEGTNPEELIGAALAACFSMALSNTLAQGGSEAESVKTTARVKLGRTEAGAGIDAIELDCVARVPGVDPAEFERLAEEARKGCIISRALAGVETISLQTRLEG